jgi:glycosyltransferase involved in cell wall biosynthesis
MMLTISRNERMGHQQGDYDTNSNALSILVAILGARMHYAVPIALAQHGALAQLYTDVYFPRQSILGDLVSILARFGPAEFRRATERFDGRLPGSKVRAFTGLGLAYALCLRTGGARNQEVWYEHFGRMFAQRVARSDWYGANAVYALNTASLEIYQSAQRAGVTCILEQTIAPLVILGQLYREEAERWPNWQEVVIGNRKLLMEREAQEWELADGIICGSQFVADGLTSCGVPRERCFIIPYTVDVERFSPGQKTYGRHGDSRLNVLYVGSVDLRKGIQYLYESLRLLDSNRYVVKVAGASSLRPEAMKQLSKYCEFLGLVPRSEVPALFRWADVFVLPTICEGSALVTYEALAAGVPVITTPNAGSVVRDGVDGFVVPIRAPGALAQRLEQLAIDPDLRLFMSREARRHAVEDLSWDAYADRLLVACKKIFNRKAGIISSSCR